MGRDPHKTPLIIPVGPGLVAELTAYLFDNNDEKRLFAALLLRLRKTSAIIVPYFVCDKRIRSSMLKLSLFEIGHIETKLFGLI